MELYPERESGVVSRERIWNCIQRENLELYPERESGMSRNPVCAMDLSTRVVRRPIRPVRAADGNNTPF